LLLTLSLALTVACTTTKAKRKEPKRKAAPVELPPSAEEACNKGLLRECETAVTGSIRDGKLDEGRALAKRLMSVRRSEGIALLNAVDDAEKRREAARRSSRVACEQGSVRACRVLANMLISEKRIEEGLPMLQRACKLNDGKACYDVVAHVKSSKEQVKHLARSCELRFAPGCHDLGESIDASGQVPEAAKAFTSGCGLGHPESCAVVARNAYSGGDVQAGRRDAAKACAGGVRFGCFIQAMAASQLGHVDEARKLLGTLCASDAFSCRELALLELTQGRKAEANKHFATACQRNDLPACAQVARTELAAGRRDQALELFKKLCDAELPQACLSAGLILEQNADRLAQDDGPESKGVGSLLTEAAARLHKACELQVGVGCLKMGYVKEKGKDAEGAQQYFTAACATGEPTACEILGKPLPSSPADSLLPARIAENVEKECDGGSIEACWTLIGLPQLAH
jgi:TPR repeat protein